MRRGRRSTTAAAALALALAVALAGCVGSLTGVKDPWPAPDFTVTDTAGVTHNLTEYEGRVLVLDLMATWCGPCKDQMPHLKKVREAYPEDKVAILSIGSDPSESNEDLDRFMQVFDADWPIAMDTDGIARKYDMKIIPKLVVIDPDGNVVFENQRETYPAVLARVLDEHVEE